MCSSFLSLRLITEITAQMPALEEFEAAHPELRASVKRIPAAMMADRAPATIRKYSGAYQRWSTWAQDHHITPIPAPPVGIACYLLFLATTAQSSSPISSALHAIDWAHRKAGLESPSMHHITRQTADRLIRLLSRPAWKMRPLTQEQLQLLVQRFGQPGCSLVHLQMVCLVLIGFHGFLRWSDMSQLQPADVHFSDGYVSLFLEGRKNDQFREGHIIPIAETGRDTCAVKWLRRFMAEGGHNTDAHLFGKVTVGKSASYIRGQMTYSCARERLKEMLTEVGLDASMFCLHSLRSGGATAALRSPGMPVRLVQRHGGWKRIESMEGYVEETLDNLLQVSRLL